MTQGYNERPSRVSLCGMRTWTFLSAEEWRKELVNTRWVESPLGYYTIRIEDEGVDNSPTPPPHDNTPEGVKHRFEGVLDDLTKRRLDEGQARQLGRAAESRIRVGSADQALGNAIGKK